MGAIKFKVVPTGISKGEIPLNRFCVMHNGLVRDDTIYRDVARKSGQPQPLVKATTAMAFDAIAENLRHGYRVEFPQMSAFLSMPGSVESTSAASRKAVPENLCANLSAKGDFKKCCRNDGTVLESITQSAVVVVDGVADEISRIPNTLTNGIDVVTHGTGRGCLITDFNDPTTGMFIADRAGTVLAKANIVESTSTTFVCVFPRLDLPEGAYKFCVASRNGLDPAQYGVTIGSKNIQIINAAPAENEGV